MLTTTVKGYQDIEGDGGSDILGQVASAKRAMEERLAGVERVIAVMSGKGGVGKSTLTANLAVSLSTLGRRVGVVDADLNGPALARMAGVAGQQLVVEDGSVVPATGAAGVRVMSMELFLKDDATPVTWKHPGGLAADTTVWRGTMEATTLREFLTDTAWGDLDYLLLDLPPGSDRFAAVAGLLPKLSGVLVVTVPALVSRTVVTKAISAARDRGDSLLGVVENMAGFTCPHCGGDSELFPAEPAEQMAASFGLPLLARIPFDPRAAASSDSGVPFVLTASDSAAASAIRELARSIDERL